MSLWDRMRGLFGGAAPPPEPKPENEAEVDPTRPLVAPRAPKVVEPEAAPPGIAALGPNADEAQILEVFEREVAAGFELRAIEACRRLLAQRRESGPRPSWPELRLRLAERLLSRGEERDADTLVAPLADDPQGALAAWMVAAELAERRGDTSRARAIYERIVARDLSFPRAKERAARLRESEGKVRDAGATLVAEGASTRRYRLREELGRGGAGTVFLAEEPSLRRLVALKVYHRRSRADRERLLVEARNAAAFSHPGVVRVLDVDETLGAIAMEPLLLGSVKALEGKGASHEARRAAMLSVACAVHHVHARGMVHCDLKPSNFLVRDASHAVLTDFGLARAVGSMPREKGEGTLAYMSPEQRGAAAAHPLMDVFALGVSLRDVLGDVPSIATLAKAMCAPDAASRPALGDVIRALDRPLAG